jgi:hypothetical protein
VALTSSKQRQTASTDAESIARLLAGMSDEERAALVKLAKKMVGGTKRASER